MTVGVGFTAAQKREFVQEYHLHPWGQKSSWLTSQGVSYDKLRRWQLAVFEGDLDRGLMPREGSPMTVPPAKRTALERTRAAERVAHEAQIAKLSERVRELEGTNDALGKAIGLLHAMSEQEPDETPTTTDPSTS
ncbi:MAG: hypothetical protein H7288_23425 [Kineosporiaceae bacterium]|nr:hypothetical protein [Aeromicrobium sp.]